MGDSVRRSIRLVVQSGRRLPHNGLLTHLANQSDIAVMAQTATLKGLYALCSLYRPDVSLIDVGILTQPIVEVLHRLRTAFPTVELVVTYNEAQPAVVGAAIKAGITALVPASAGPDTVARLVRQRADTVRPTSSRQVLTERELAVVALMGAGRSVLEMAELLRISPHTVENHKRSIYAKFGVGNQSHAVSRAMSLGLFDGANGGAPAHTEGPRQPPMPPPDPSLAGRILAVVRGPAGVGLDEVTQALVASGIAFVQVRQLGPVANDHWAQWNRAKALVVLVDPAPDDWEIAIELDAPAVVVQSSMPDVALAVDVVLHGAYALLWRDDVARDLLSVMALVSNGYRVLDSRHVRLLSNWMSALISRPTSSAPQLTARERDILGSIASGHTVRQTARSLGIATKTVENTQARLFRKLGTHNRPETLIAAYRLGLIVQ
jgi:DNA-binding NarL/FixJ family response regulator